MQRHKFKQETAYEMELAISTFHNMLEPLEEYIGKLECYPDWSKKRQLYRNTIKDSNDTLEGFEDLFLTQLLIVTGAVGKKPTDFRKKIQEEYYRWIGATGIDTNNIPSRAEKLKHYLFEINEILEGRGEKIFNQTKELIKGQDIKPQDALWLAGASQKHLSRSDERKNALKGKVWNELKNESKFGSGSNDQGEQAFGRIAGTVADKHKDFRFYPQEGRLNSPQQRTNSEIIQDVKNNPQNWRIDEINTGYDVFNRAKKVSALVHSSAQISYDGVVSDDRQPVYLAQRFNSEEIGEINRVKNISQSTSNQQNNYSQKELVEGQKNANELQKNKGKVDTGRIFAITTIGALLIGGAVVTKKQLNKKLKK